MANFRYTLTGDTAAQQLVTVSKPRALTEWLGTFNAYGTFGSGTLSYLLSTDGGTTKVAMKDISGTAYSTTTADAVNIAMGVPNTNKTADQMIVYAALTGSTNPAITIDVADNT